MNVWLAAGLTAALAVLLAFNGWREQAGKPTDEKASNKP